MEATPLVIGISFETAPAAVCDRFRIAAQSYAAMLSALVRGEAIEEAAVLSTGSRTEFIVCSSDPATSANSVLRHLSRELNLSLEEWGRFQRHVGDAALLHLLRLASGETGVRADLEYAYQEAQRARSLGRSLQVILSRVLAFAGQSRLCEQAEAGVRAELAALRAQLAETQGHPVMAELRAHLEGMGREELERMHEDLGPFTAEQQAVLETLAANLMRRITSSLQRQLAAGALEEESLAKAIRELFDLRECAAPDARGAAAGAGK